MEPNQFRYFDVKKCRYFRDLEIVGTIGIECPNLLTDFWVFFSKIWHAKLKLFVFLPKFDRINMFLERLLTVNPCELKTKKNQRPTTSVYLDSHS
jgi:hypothetical protein